MITAAEAATLAEQIRLATIAEAQEVASKDYDKYEKLAEKAIAKAIEGGAFEATVQVYGGTAGTYLAQKLIATLKTLGYNASRYITGTENLIVISW